MRTPALICACLTLAACAQMGRPLVATVGAERLKNGGAYALVGSGLDGAVPEPLGARVGEALKGAGLHLADDLKSADYLVHVSWATGPSKVGALVPPEDPKSTTEPEWRVRPTKAPWSIVKRYGQTLTVDVVDRASGQELRRISISGATWKNDPATAVLRLSDALKAPLTP